MSCFCLGYNALDRLFVIFKFVHIDVSMLKLPSLFELIDFNIYIIEQILVSS